MPAEQLHRRNNWTGQKWTREEIAQTVATPAEVDEELRCLMIAMSG